MGGYGDPMMGTGVAVLISTFALMWVVIGVPLWRILTRAGFSGLWILLFVFLPPIGLLVIVPLLAFAQWPTLQRRTGE